MLLPAQQPSAASRNSCAGFECLSEDVADVMGLFSEVILQPALPQAKLDLFKSQARGCKVSWCSTHCSCWPSIGTCHAAAANGRMGTEWRDLHPLQARVDLVLAHSALSKLGIDTDLRTGHTAETSSGEEQCSPRTSLRVPCSCPCRCSLLQHRQGPCLPPACLQTLATFACAGAQPAAASERQQWGHSPP